MGDEPETIIYAALADGVQAMAALDHATVLLLYGIGKSELF